MSRETLASRSFRHSFPERSYADASTGQILPEVRERLQGHLDDLVKVIRQNAESKGSSVYVGSPGIAYAFVKVAQTMSRRPSSNSVYLRIAESFLPSLVDGKSRRTKPTDASLLCGDAGVLLVRAALAFGKWKEKLQSNPGCQADKDVAESEAQFQRHAKEYLSYAEHTADMDADEWLYGRAGYLYGCLLLRQWGGEETVPTSIIDKIADEVFDSGSSYARRCKDAFSTDDHYPSLLYEWCGELYVGAVHGFVGILFILLHVESIRSSHHRMACIQQTIGYILRLENPDSNWPVILGRTDYHLLHFCHGAPGIVYLLSLGKTLLNDSKCEQAALRAGETVWRYGLLRKGPGLCHGIAGNGYALLCLYKMTGDTLWLNRAISFALQIFDEEMSRHCRTPDHPYSLYEGLAGTLCFLADLVDDPKRASFPLFELGEANS